MNPKKQDNNQDMSIEQYDEVIMKSGRKLTRAAKNQIRSQQAQAQAQAKSQAQSEKSLDSLQSQNKISQQQQQMQKRSSNLKMNKKSSNKSIVESAQVGSTNILPKYLGHTNLNRYLSTIIGGKQSLNLQQQSFQTKFTIESKNLYKVPRPQLSFLTKCFIGSEQSGFEIRSGQIIRKNNKSSRDQVIVELQTAIVGKPETRAINQEKGYVFSGQALVLVKLYFEDFKRIFRKQIEDLRNKYPEESLVQKQKQHQEIKPPEGQLSLSDQVIDLQMIHQEPNQPQSPSSKIPQQQQQQPIQPQPQQKQIQEPSEQSSLSFVEIDLRTNQFHQQHNKSSISIISSLQQSQNRSESIDSLDDHHNNNQPLQQSSIKLMSIEQESPSQEQNPYPRAEEAVREDQIIVEGGVYTEAIVGQADLDQGKNEVLQQKSEQKMQTQENQGKQEQPLSVLSQPESKRDQFIRKMFQKFILPSSDFILWPSVVYEPIYGHRNYLYSIIEQQMYQFHEIHKSHFFHHIFNHNVESLFEEIIVNKNINMSTDTSRPQSSEIHNHSFSSAPNLHSEISDQHLHHFSSENLNTKNQRQGGQSNTLDPQGRNLNNKVKNLQLSLNLLRKRAQNHQALRDNKQSKNVIASEKNRSEKKPLLLQEKQEIRLFVELIGLNKFITIPTTTVQQQQQKYTLKSTQILLWENIPQEELNNFILNSHLKVFGSQIHEIILKLNEFYKNQYIQDVKADDIKNCLFRIAKCKLRDSAFSNKKQYSSVVRPPTRSPTGVVNPTKNPNLNLQPSPSSSECISTTNINNNTLKQYLCIPIRYSHVERKILIMVFLNSQETVQSTLVWTEANKLFFNFTIPNVSQKDKIFLYLKQMYRQQKVRKIEQSQQQSQTNEFHNQISLPSLKEFIRKLYSDFLIGNDDSSFELKQILQNQISKRLANDTTQQTYQHKTQKCVDCYFPIHNLPFYQCIFCQKYCHQQCSNKTLNKIVQINLLSLNMNKHQIKEEHPQPHLNTSSTPASEYTSPQTKRSLIQSMISSGNLWICDECEPCTLCVQPLGKTYLKCIKCSAMLHEKCGKILINEDLNIITRDRFMCENCIQCRNCQKKLKGIDFVQNKTNYQYECKNCKQKDNEDKEICFVCKKKSQGAWIQCSRTFCKKWVHKKCDKLLAQSNYFKFKSSNKIYFCPHCRHLEHRKILLKCIDFLSLFDEQQYFTDATYEDILDYKYVVQQPICFQKMKQRCISGHYDHEPMNKLSTDFQTLVSNALKYNMPKDQPHYRARILNIMGQFALRQMKDIIECTQEEIIEGGLLQKLKEIRLKVFKEIQQKYLEMILNYKSQHSTVEVIRRVREKNDKPQLIEQPYIFNSKYILNSCFRSCSLKFKISKKTPRIENLFETQKLIQAFRSPLRQNYCYYHYWNSNVTFYCEVCMEFYCCIKKCYRHQTCNVCQIKQCACDAYTCGCPPLKEKQRRHYEKQMLEKFYDKRQLTNNYELCLKCAFERLNTQICVYCQKSYEYQYDFQECSICNKKYHRQCADSYGSKQLNKYFLPFQDNNNGNNFHNGINNSDHVQYFSSTLRLNNTCFECSRKRQNQHKMFEKLKAESIQKLIKLHQLSKYLKICANIFMEEGIKVHLNEISNLIFSNYDKFLTLQDIFQEYRLNYPQTNLIIEKHKTLKRKLTEKIKQQNLHIPLIHNPTKPNPNTNSPTITIKKLVNPTHSTISPQSILFNHLKQFYKWYYIQNKWNELSYLYKYLNHHQSAQGQNRPKFQTIITLVSFQKFESVQIQINQSKFINNWSSERAAAELDQTKHQHKGFLNKPPHDSSNSSLGFVQVPILDCMVEFQQKGQLQQQSKQLSNENDDDSLPTTLTQQNNQFYSVSIFIDLIELRIKMIKGKISKQNKSSARILGKYEDLRPYLALFKDSSYHNQPKCLLSTLSQMHSKQEKEGMNELINDKLFANLFEDYETYTKEMHTNSTSQPENQNSEKQHPEAMQIQKPQNDENTKPKLPSKTSNTTPTTTSVQPSYEKIQQETSLQESLYESFQRTRNDSKLSQMKRCTIIQNTIRRFLLECYEMNKSVYRRGNTCVLKSQVGNWRVLKKDKNMKSYEISLKRESGKWFFSINENVWLISTVDQILSKLKPLGDLSSFRDLANFLGFTFKFVPLEKAQNFTKFLQTNPLDEMYAFEKKKMVQEVYDTYEWQRNGYFKKKILQQNEQVKQYAPTKKKPFYLTKRNHKQQNFLQKQRSNPPYITYQDLQKDLDDNVLSFSRQQSFIYKQPSNNVFIAPSTIHKLGLFARQRSPKGTIMVEYIGQIVGEALADLRQANFHFGCYMFGLNRRNLDKKEIIDATFRGNMARYLNHSCDPNCKAKVEVINGHPRIFIYSMRDIEKYEELTYDYQFSIDANEKLICTCNAKNCQGRLN